MKYLIKKYESYLYQQTITIQNGDVRIANRNFASPYSIYEIRSIPSTIISTYKSITFNPFIQIDKHELRNIVNCLHGALIGKRKLYSCKTEKIYSHKLDQIRLIVEK